MIFICEALVLKLGFPQCRATIKEMLEAEISDNLTIANTFHYKNVFFQRDHKPF